MLLTHDCLIRIILQSLTEEAFVEATVSAMILLFHRLLGARQAVYVTYADIDFFLSIVDSVNLSLHVVIHLSDLAYHYLNLRDAFVRLIIESMQFLHLFLNLLLAGVGLQLSVDALNV